MIDLHIHTNASADGQFPPDVIVEMAREINLEAIAFADHNTVGSVQAGRKLCASAGIEFVSCIELNTEFENSDVHMLAYGIDETNPDFLSWLEEVTKKRFARAKAWADRFVELGLEIRYDDVLDLTPGQPPTGSSFLRTLKKNPNNHRHELVRPYLPDGEKGDNPYVNFYFEVMVHGPAVVHVDELSTLDAISRILEFGAVPVLAHPAALNEKQIDPMVENGLIGIEAISSYHDDAMKMRHLKYAESRALLVTAGSDFHGPKFKKHVKLGGIEGNHRSLFDKLMEKVTSRSSS